MPEEIINLDEVTDNIQPEVVDLDVVEVKKKDSSASPSQESSSSSPSTVFRPISAAGMVDAQAPFKGVDEKGMYTIDPERRIAIGADGTQLPQERYDEIIAKSKPISGGLNFRSDEEYQNSLTKKYDTPKEYQAAKIKQTNWILNRNKIVDQIATADGEKPKEVGQYYGRPQVRDMRVVRPSDAQHEVIYDLTQKKDYDLAIQTAQTALEKSEHDSYALRSLVDNMEAKGDFPGALKYIDKAVANNPKDNQLLNYKSYASIKTGDFGTALMVSDKVIDNIPGDTRNLSALNQLTYAYQTKITALQEMFAAQGSTPAQEAEWKKQIDELTEKKRYIDARATVIKDQMGREAEARTISGVTQYVRNPVSGKVEEQLSGNFTDWLLHNPVLAPGPAIAFAVSEGIGYGTEKIIEGLPGMLAFNPSTGQGGEEAVTGSLKVVQGMASIYMAANPVAMTGFETLRAGSNILEQLSGLFTPTGPGESNLPYKFTPENYGGQAAWDNSKIANWLFSAGTTADVAGNTAELIGLDKNNAAIREFANVVNTTIDLGEMMLVFGALKTIGVEPIMHGEKNMPHEEMLARRKSLEELKNRPAEDLTAQERVVAQEREAFSLIYNRAIKGEGLTNDEKAKLADGIREVSSNPILSKYVMDAWNQYRVARDAAYTLQDLLPARRDTYVNGEVARQYYENSHNRVLDEAGKSIAPIAPDSFVKSAPVAPQAPARVEVPENTRRVIPGDQVLINDDAVGMDVRYRGYDGVLVKEDSKWVVVDDATGKRVEIEGSGYENIPDTKTGEMRPVTAEDLGVDIMEPATQGDIMQAMERKGQTGITEYKGRQYFVSMAAGAEDAVGDLVFEVKPGGKVVKFYTTKGNANERIEIINSFLNPRGLERQKRFDKIKAEGEKKAEEVKTEEQKVADTEAQAKAEEVKVPEPPIDPAKENFIVVDEKFNDAHEVTAESGKQKIAIYRLPGDDVITVEHSVKNADGSYGDPQSRTFKKAEGAQAYANRIARRDGWKPQSEIDKEKPVEQPAVEPVKVENAGDLDFTVNTIGDPAKSYMGSAAASRRYMIDKMSQVSDLDGQISAMRRQLDDNKVGTKEQKKLAIKQANEISELESKRDELKQRSQSDYNEYVNGIADIAVEHARRDGLNLQGDNEKSFREDVILTLSGERIAGVDTNLPINKIVDTFIAEYKQGDPIRKGEIVEIKSDQIKFQEDVKNNNNAKGVLSSGQPRQSLNPASVTGAGQETQEVVRLVKGTGNIAAGQKVTYNGRGYEVAEVRAGKAVLKGYAGDIEVDPSKVEIATVNTFTPLKDALGQKGTEFSVSDVSYLELGTEIKYRANRINLEVSEYDVDDIAIEAIHLMNQNKELPLSRALDQAAENVRKIHEAGRNASRELPTYRKRITSTPNGYEHSTPHKTLNDAVRSNPNVKGNNLWVRQSDLRDNSNRTLLVQFSSDLLNGGRRNAADLAEVYYDKLYRTRPGYDRTFDFWEVPLWMSRLAHIAKESDVYVIRDMAEAKKFFDKARYKNIAFSALDINKGHIVDITDALPRQKFSVGGYTKFDDLQAKKNVTIYNSVSEFAKQNGHPDEHGYSYRHFTGTRVIPRLKMSDGCKFKCAFCTVPKKVEEVSKEVIDAQVESIKDLDARLVYLDDKTFGQSPNYEYLTEIYDRVKESNPDFEGFIIQTTAGTMLKFSDEFLQKAHIKYVELGVESYNDAILKKLHKPASEKTIDQAVEKIRQNNISFVPNIVVGFTGKEMVNGKEVQWEENTETYQHTADFLRRNNDVTSHANVYNLALYEGTELADNIETKIASDNNENITSKSFHKDKEVHEKAARDFTEIASSMLDKDPGKIKIVNSEPVEKNTPDPALKARVYRIGFTNATDKDSRVGGMIRKAQALEAAGKYSAANKIFNAVLDEAKADVAAEFSKIEGVKVRVDNTKGTFFTYTEPTFELTVTDSGNHLGEIVAATSRMGEKYRQDNIHVSEVFPSLPEGAKFSAEPLTDGSVWTPNIEVRFDNKLGGADLAKVNNLVDKNGLAGSTVHSDKKGLTLYNIPSLKENEEFIRQIGEFTKVLDNGGIRFETQHGARRLYNVGRSDYGGTRTYEQGKAYRNQDVSRSERVEYSPTPWLKSSGLADMEDQYASGKLTYEELVAGRKAAGAQKRAAWMDRTSDERTYIGDMPQAVGHLESIIPIESPELVQFAKEMLGRYPSVVKMNGLRGVFYPREGESRIQVSPTLSPKQFMATLAHELGHADDYFPQESMSQGNLIGRIHKMREFMNAAFSETTGALSSKDLATMRRDLAREYAAVNGHDFTKMMKGEGFTPVERKAIAAEIDVRMQRKIDALGIIKNKDIKAELIALSKEWRPWRREASDAKTIRYRDSSPELYADAISSLLNDPAWTASVAPKFFNSFFEQLDKRPEFRDQYFGVQELLHGDRNHLLAVRAENIHKGFKEASDRMLKALDKPEELGKLNAWEQLIYNFISKSSPYVRRIEEKNKDLGLVLSPRQNLRNAIEVYETSGVNREIIVSRDMENNVRGKILEAGIDMNEFGEILAGERIVLGDRKDKINFLGHNPGTMGQRMLDIRSKYTDEQNNIMDAATASLHKTMFDISTEAYEQGIISKKNFEEIVVPNKDTYVTFTPLKYADRIYLSAGIKQVVGDLGEIANPYGQTMLKMMSMVRAIERQKALRQFRSSWDTYFPGEVHDKLPQGWDAGKSKVTMWKDGKIVDIYVDPALADIFKRMSSDEVKRYTQYVDWFNEGVGPLGFKKIVTAYNIGWAFYTNLFRDQKRTVNNLLTILSSVEGVGGLESAGLKGKAAIASIGNLIPFVPPMLYTYPSAFFKGVQNSWKFIRKNGEAYEWTPEIRELLEQGVISTRKFGSYDVRATEDMMPIWEKRFGGFLDTKDAWYQRNLITRAASKAIESIPWWGALFENGSKFAGYQVLKNKFGNAKIAGYYARNFVGTPNYNEAGGATPIMNRFFPFSNVILQGMREDVSLAIRPQTRGAYWMIQTISTVMPAVAIAGAATGLFGDETKKAYDNIPEYDKANFMTIPMMGQSAGKHGVLYFRIPLDEMSRLLYATTYKAMTAARGEMKSPEQVVQLGTGMIPTYTPLFQIAGNWLAWLGGKNPIDAHTERPVVKDKDQFNAGMKYSIDDMALWTVKTAGLSTYLGFMDMFKDPRHAQFTPAEWGVKIEGSALRFLKYSDSGLKELSYESEADNLKSQAIENIEQEDLVARLSKIARVDPNPLAHFDKYQQSIYGSPEIQKWIKENAYLTPTAIKSKVEGLSEKLKWAYLLGSDSPNYRLITKLQKYTNVEDKIDLLDKYATTFGYGPSEKLKLFSYLAGNNPAGIKVISKDVIEAYVTKFEKHVSSQK